MAFWDVFSSGFLLAVFVGVVFAVIKIQRSISSSTESTVEELRSKGVSYEDGKLKITTDQAAPTRQEYIASTQRAFERGAKQMSLHPEAFKVGQSDKNEVAEMQGKTSAIETPEKKTFQRPKKLD